jgi:hypothetical protein
VLDSVGVRVELAEEGRDSFTICSSILTCHTTLHYTTSRCHCIVFLDFIAIYVTVV